MNINPEFQRQLYLECSPARLAGIPLTLWALLTLGYLLDDRRLGPATAKTALALYALIVLLWGARQAMDSITEEYRERTWDTQRLSALSPWALTWGKLLGGTLMAWYAGGICLVAFSLALGPSPDLGLRLFYAIGAGLLAQSGGLLYAQIRARHGQIKNGSLFFLGVICLLTIFPWWTRLTGSTPAFDLYADYTLIWYDWEIDGRLFWQLSLVSAIGWCITGNYRLMRQALGLRDAPWTWLAFTLFLMIYLGGAAPSSYLFLLTSFLICGALAYIGVVVEKNDALRFIRLLAYLKQSDWRQFCADTPIWCINIGLAAPVAVWLGCMRTPTGIPWRPDADAGVFMFIPLLLLKVSSNPAGLANALHFYPMPLLLLLIKDCSFYLYFCLGKNPQRAFSLTALCTIMLYAVLPGVFGLAGLSWLSALAFPLWADSAAGALAWTLPQSALVLYLLRERWKRVRQPS